jgi:hypothetical protein
MLNLSNIISEFHTIDRFVTADFETRFHTLHVGMFKIQLHARFHMLSSNGSLRVALI